MLDLYASRATARAGTDVVWPATNGYTRGDMRGATSRMNVDVRCQGSTPVCVWRTPLHPVAGTW